jgi:hypothetical protein
VPDVVDALPIREGIPVTPLRQNPFGDDHERHHRDVHSQEHDGERIRCAEAEVGTQGSSHDDERPERVRQDGSHILG